MMNATRRIWLPSAVWVSGVFALVVLCPRSWGADVPAEKRFEAEVRPDNTGHGFDTIGDVLSLSPLHLEKYIAAAKSIMAQTMPMAPAVVAEKRITGMRFKNADGTGGTGDGPLQLSYTKAAVV